MNNFKTYQLAVDFYKSAKLINIKSPIVRDQFERASLSIVLNLAEGSGKGTAKDRRRRRA